MRVQTVSAFNEGVRTREGTLPERNRRIDFEAAVLPHLDAAYNLARWLTRNDSDAEDVVQESYLRAFKAFDGFRGGDSRAWMLKIVRNTGYTWLQRNRSRELTTEFDESVHRVENNNPETTLIEQADVELLKKRLEELPVEFREVVILRELEGMSYREIAAVAGVPLGTVMSRLSRARERLQACLSRSLKGGSS